MKTNISFLVNDVISGPLGIRAREFARRMPTDYHVHIAYRGRKKLHALAEFFEFLRRTKPEIGYVFDMGYSGVMAASLYKKIAPMRLIVETGDAIYELARSSGMRSRLGLELTRWLEQFALRSADRVVVRGTFHQHWLQHLGIESDVIQDGVNMSQFKPMDVAALRADLGLANALTVGVVGSLEWSEKLQWCYGQELIEAIRLLKKERIIGIIIGNGSGVDHLKQRCRDYGIRNQVRFWRRVPFDELPQRLCLMDVCLSTQTNNLVGRVRTTGKLPLYLAAGRYVLASDVGEASLVLPPEMRIDYIGVKDDYYPVRLAKRLSELCQHPEILKREGEITACARTHFDYDLLIHKFLRTIDPQSAEIKQPVSLNGAFAKK